MLESTSTGTSLLVQSSSPSFGRPKSPHPSLHIKLASHSKFAWHTPQITLVQRFAGTQPRIVITCTWWEAQLNISSIWCTGQTLAFSDCSCSSPCSHGSELMAAVLKRSTTESSRGWSLYLGFWPSGPSWLPLQAQLSTQNNSRILLMLTTCPFKTWWAETCVLGPSMLDQWCLSSSVHGLEERRQWSTTGGTSKDGGTTTQKTHQETSHHNLVIPLAMTSEDNFQSD